LNAARHLEHAQPGTRLLDWLARLPEGALQWDDDATARFFELLRTGGPRSWRFLVATGVLERALPELADAIHRRRADPLLLDPVGVLRWDLVETVGEQLADSPPHLRDLIVHPEWLVLAALVLDVADDDDETAVAAARALTRRLDLGPEAEGEVELLVGESELLLSAARRIDAFDEMTVARLAVHLRRRERAAALAVLTRARHDLDMLDQQRLDQLWTLLDRVLADFADSSPNLGDVLEMRSAAALALIGENPLARRRVESGPRAWLLSGTPESVARQAVEIYPVPSGDDVRVFVVEGESTVDVVCADRKGLLAAVTGAIEAVGLDIESAVAATWVDGMALSSFRVRDVAGLDPVALRAEVLRLLDTPDTVDGVEPILVRFDDRASPWCTLLDVDAFDRPGLLHAVTAAIAASGAQIHSARARTTADGRVTDTFELTDHRGAKLTADVQHLISVTLSFGTRGMPKSRRRSLLPRR
jgi:[protein-PII] uridylyltransferase